MRSGPATEQSFLPGNRRGWQIGLPGAGLACLIAVFAAQALWILVTGRYAFSLLGLTWTARSLATPLLPLLLLVALRIWLGGRTAAPSTNRDARLLFCLSLTAYLLNGETLSTPDTLPARVLPWGLLLGQGFTLDAFPALTGGDPAHPPYFLRHMFGHWVSDYPVGAALLALPFYLPAALGGADPRGRILIDLEKLAAATAVAASAALLFAVLRRDHDRRVAWWVTLLYALGTSSLSISSQALWQHGPGQLALAAGLYCLIRARSAPAWAAWAGLPLAFAVVARPTNGILAAALGAHAVGRFPGKRWCLLAAAAPPVLFNLWYNGWYFGDPFRTQFPIFGIWNVPIWEGLPGILVSPGRGLLVYSPILVLAGVGTALVWRSGGPPLLRALSVGTAATILLYGKYDVWWGGWTFGPRLLADLNPALALLLAPAFERLRARRAFWVIVLVLGIWSAAAHAIGVTQRAPYWNADVDGERFTEELWSWSDNQLVNPVRDWRDRGVIERQALSTSATDPPGLRAAYRTDLPGRLAMPAPGTLRLSLTAENRGAAVWLVGPPGRRGAVRLVWRWTTDERPIPGTAGEMGLRRHVFPGETYGFDLTVRPPREPGSYRLEADLVSEAVGRFSALGSAPFRLLVVVASGPAAVPTEDERPRGAPGQPGL